MMNVLLFVCLLLTGVASDTNPVRRRHLLVVENQEEKATLLEEDSSFWGRLLEKEMSMSCQGMWNAIVMVIAKQRALHSWTILNKYSLTHHHRCSIHNVYSEQRQERKKVQRFVLPMASLIFWPLKEFLSTHTPVSNLSFMQRKEENRREARNQDRQKQRKERNYYQWKQRKAMNWQRKRKANAFAISMCWSHDSTQTSPSSLTRSTSPVSPLGPSYIHCYSS